MAAKICLTISGARPSDGSSRSSRRGRAIRARAIASICCSPPDSVPPRWPWRFSRIGNMLEGAGQVLVEIARDRSTVAPICRFSSTVMRGKMRRPSGDCEMPSRAISWVGMLGDVLAVEDDRAGAGARRAADGHHQGRLAGTVGADQGDDLALLDVDVDALEGLDLAVEGLDAADREKGFAHGLLVSQRLRQPPRRRAATRLGLFLLSTPR